MLLVGNAAIAGTSAVLRWASPPAADVPGVPKFAAVDDHVWRGGAPSERGYRELAERGVRTIVDLRAEEDLPDTEPVLAELGVRLVRIPIRDGQAPTSEQSRQFLQVVRETSGVVFVHCGAGIGRTGAVAASYLVSTGEAGAADALRRNLELGPPSLEQIVYVADLDGGEDSAEARPPAAVVAMSRVLDAPRRLWSRYGL